MYKALGLISRRKKKKRKKKKGRKKKTIYRMEGIICLSHFR
jgi:hypothetical protein